MYQQDDNIPTKSHSEFSRRDKRNGDKNETIEEKANHSMATVDPMVLMILSTCCPFKQTTKQSEMTLMS